MDTSKNSLSGVMDVSSSIFSILDCLLTEKLVRILTNALKLLVFVRNTVQILQEASIANATNNTTTEKTMNTRANAAINKNHGLFSRINITSATCRRTLPFTVWCIKI